MEVPADFIDNNVPLLLGLDVLTKLEMLPDVGNTVMTSPNINWEMPLTFQIRKSIYFLANIEAP